MTIIAIDGPAGSGKSTVARAVAARLGLPHIDTGAYYRAATLASLEAGVDVTDEQAVVAVVERIRVDRSADRTLLDGRDVEDEIRRPRVDEAVSVVAAHPPVRALLRERQRAAVAAPGGVVEGRDAGTHVVPGADLKIWLTAEPEARAQRRAADHATAGARHVDAAYIAQQAAALAARDRMDQPNMEQAADVWTVDSSCMTVDEVVDRVLMLLDDGS